MCAMRNRRAVSEIVASLMMLTIVSIAGAMLYHFTLQTIGTQQDSLLFDVNLQKTRSMERFEILSVRLVDSNGIKITFLNYGEVDNNIVAVYIDDKPVDIISDSGVASKLDIGYLIVESNFSGSSMGVRCEVKIVSKEGISAATNALL